MQYFHIMVVLNYISAIFLGCVIAVALPDPFKHYTIAASDGSVTAKFIGSGASLTELWVKDKYGHARNVVLGYDNLTLWQTDPNHPCFGSIIGRYANRIANGTFSIPISKNPDPNSPNTYHIFRNDYFGLNTLHGGKIGWDRRNWTFAGATANTISFVHFDPADEGFPGNVTAKVTHSLSTGGKYDITLVATATEKTPIMVTQHTYWNLDAFKESQDILGHYLRVASSKTIQGDEYLVPNGNFTQVQGTALDFRVPQTIGYKWNQTLGNSGCGPDCPGYDNAWIFDKPQNAAPNLSLYSKNSGIKLEVISNQPVVQLYTSNGLSIPRKVVHGGPTLLCEPHSAIAIELQSYDDAINNPAWGIDQIYYPGRDYKWITSYKFSVV